MSNNCFDNCQFVQQCLVEQAWLFEDMEREESMRLDDVMQVAANTGRHAAWNEWLDRYGYDRSRKYDKTIEKMLEDADRREQGYHTDMEKMQNKAEAYGMLAETAIQACENQGPHITKRWKMFGRPMMKCSSPTASHYRTWELPGD